MRAGTAKRDISPTVPLALYGYPHVQRISTGIHDPLWASVSVLESDGAVVVLASLDVLMIEPAFARDLRIGVAAAIGCDEAGVFISCTHTHSGPVTSRLIAWQNDEAVPRPDSDYLEFLKVRLIEAAISAAESREAAEIAWATADASGVGGNRLKIDGITDTQCGVLAIRRIEDKRILGIHLIYGMHPTVLHEDSTLVSSDFPHYTRKHLNDIYGDHVIVVYHTAPCGNQSPRYFVEGQTFDEAERLGQRLGDAVCLALGGGETLRWNPDPGISMKIARISLVRNPIVSTADANHALSTSRAHYRTLQQNGAPKAEVRTAECEVFGAEGAVVLAHALKQDETVKFLEMYSPSDVQVFCVDGVCIAGVPGEWFTEYALEMKKTSGGFVVSLVNGDLQGYIVTEEAAIAGGYEAANAVFGVASGAVMVSKVEDIIQDMLDT